MTDQLPDVVDLVLFDIQERKAFGLQRYGIPLKPFNGKDALKEAYEEALDLVIYLRQVIAEQNNNGGT